MLAVKSSAIKQIIHKSKNVFLSCSFWSLNLSEQDFRFFKTYLVLLHMFQGDNKVSGEMGQKCEHKA